jgi:DUF218 domain
MIEDKQILENLQLVWDYLAPKYVLKSADLIWVLCSSDLDVARHSAEIYSNGYSKKILFSGGFGRLTQGVFKKPEAEIFAEIANLEHDIPLSDIIIENLSTNTGENIIFGSNLLDKLDFKPGKIILVQKPYMLRRSYNTFMAQYPHRNYIFELFCSSQNITLVDYLKKHDQEIDLIINTMVGDLDRIINYPKLGYMIQDIVPDSVLHAFQFLISKGITNL